MGKLRVLVFKYVSWFLGLLLLILIPSGEVGAQYIHRYQDAEGVWHFSDTLPETGQAVESQEALASAPEQKLRLFSESGGRGDTLYAANDYFGPVQVAVELKKATNIRVKDHSGFVEILSDGLRSYTLPAGYAGALFTLSPRQPHGAWRYHYQYRYVPGDPRTDPKSRYHYRLPFGEGPFLVTQAFRGRASHQDPHNRFAVDFAMPVGTPILSARAGVVMEAMGDYFWAGDNLDYYGPRSNLVRILHDDGTMALYAHIQRGSLAVAEGQRVAAGDMLARSGNTGYSSGPHLHFCILVNIGMEVVSIPFKFAGKGLDGIIPRQGMLMSVEK